MKNFIPHQGGLLIKNLPVDQELIPTPATSDFDFNQKKTFISEACSIGIGCLLGEVFGYKNEKSGSPIHNNFATQKGKDSISNEGSNFILPFHVEDIHTWPYAPDYVMLFCLRGCREGKALTYLLNSADIVKQLDAATLIQLRKKEYFTKPPQSFSGDADGNGIMPVLSGSEEMPFLMIEFTDTGAVTNKAQRALDAFKNACNNSPDIIEICLEQGDLLIFDNRVNIHSRSVFPAFFDGQDRWLQRTFIHDGGMRPWKTKLRTPLSNILNL